MPTPLFVMPRDPSTWGGAAALWVTVAGWAGAARRLGHRPLMLTPSRMMSEEECLETTASTSSRTPHATTARIPAPVRQLVRDGQRWAQMRQYRPTLAQVGPRGLEIPFVWQHHELFHNAGERLAHQAGSPLLEYVHAPVVWEARRWGVTRPGWGRALARLGDAPQLRRADLIACVSQEVADEVVRLGGPADRVLVSPMGVDPERFGPHVSAGEWRALFQNVGQFVIGWVGSFRRFHAIELLLDAVQLLHQQGADIALVLVGDGPDRSHLERRVVDLGINNRVLFTGQVANTDVPTVLAAFDTAIITAERGQDFHYSPLKLREYLAMALPVVVPRIGEMARNLEDGTHGLLYEPGNRDELASTIGVLIDNPLRRTALGAAGYDLLCRTGTWDVLLASALTRLRELG